MQSTGSLEAQRPRSNLVTQRQANRILTRENMSYLTPNRSQTNAATKATPQYSTSFAKRVTLVVLHDSL